MRTIVNKHRWMTVTAIAVATALTLAACGSTSPTAESAASAPAEAAASASTEGSAVSAVPEGRTEAFVRDFAAWSTPPAAIAVTTPHSKPAPEGMSIAYITCGLPTCTTISDSVKSAAELLGWKFTALGSEPTPEAIKAAWGQAVRLKPDAVFSSGFPSSIFAPELAELTAMGTGVFNCCGAPDDAMTMVVVTPEAETAQGRYTAALAANFAKGTPNVLYVNLPEFGAIPAQYPVFQKALQEYAPGAKEASIDIPNSALGTTAATTIVSYLRSHPDVNYIALTQDALSTGLPAALKAAGLDVPFSGNGGGPQPREMVASGQQAGTVEFPIDQVFWTMVDGFIRWKNGDSVEPDVAALKPPPYFLFTGENATDTPSTIVPGLKEKFATLWGR